VTTYTVSFAGVNLNDFSYSDYSKNVSNGYVFSVGGVYGESGKMSAYTDGNSQYVPLWNSSNGAYSIAPDDGALWTEESGFTFEISTAGYKNVCFTAQMYTTAQGPNSVSLQYSLDGKNWVDTNNNFVLPANKALEQAYMTTALPDECANKAKVYIRVVTAENLTNSGTTLHNNASKGNLYINNVVVSGDDDGTYKMPYTNKTTSYFGNGTIKYISPDGTNMQYLVTDSENNVIVSGTYPQDGINIAGIDGFNDKSAGMYTVSVWAGDDDDRSIVNTRTYYYKGETVVKFNYSDTKRPLADYLDATQTVATNTSGANTGALSMYPNGETATMLSYSGSYGVKVSWTADNIFASTKKLNEVDGNGYWLITASTKGYTDLTLNLEQLSSNKGPRDWGIAYSLDGKTYKYLDSSNVRAISNDSSTSTVETYNNLALPAECADKDVVYIKVFINGGESVDGTELELVTKGNTGINAVEISGVPLPQDYDVTITTVAYEDAQKTVVGTTPIDTTIVIDGNEYKTENGSVTVSLTEFKNYSVTASVSGTFPTTQKVAIHEGATQVTIPVVALDMNGDGYVNAKDYAFIKRNVTNAEQKKYLNSIFDNFLGYPDIDM
jgi:hypothetical protein